MKILTVISRVIIGSLFIVSGLIKANDPIGFSYKLEEYFTPDVLNLEWMVPFALLLAVIICIVEIVLGAATIMGAKIKLTSGLLLVMMGLFTFLTFYSAYFEKVTDCGCFGDAIKLTPWHSFYKDVCLLILSLYLFFQRKTIPPNTLKQDIVLTLISIILIAGFSGVFIAWNFPIYFTMLMFSLILVLKRSSFLPERSALIVISISLLFSLSFSIYILRHLPIMDFRPYKIKTNIKEEMKECEELKLPCDEYKVIYTLVEKSTGNTMEMGSKEWIEKKMWEDKSWELLPEKTESILVKKGYEAPIKDFSIITFDGEDITNQVLEEPRYTFLVIAYDINNSNNITAAEKISKLANQSDKIGYKVYGLTASTYEDTESFRHQVQAMYDYFNADEKTLKTIIRSNPGILLMQKGVIIGKWHVNDLPEMKDLIENYININV